MRKKVATCICEGCYNAGAFTYGNKYEVLSHDLEKSQIRICGDNNRTRWYKDYYFDLTGADALRVSEIRWEFDDLDGNYEPEEPSNDIEFITVTLSDGSKWDGTVYTFRNFAEQVGIGRKISEESGGRYYWKSKLLLVDEMRRKRVKEVVEHLLSHGEFKDIFEHVTDETGI